VTASRDVSAASAATASAAGEVPSPCNSVCRMDAAGTYCIGCFRTLDEIAGWTQFGSDRRLQIWNELPARRAQSAS